MNIYPHITKTKLYVRICLCKDRINSKNTQNREYDENGEWIRKEKALKDALRRAKCMVVDYALNNDFTHFGTITVNGKWHDISSVDGEKQVLDRVLNAFNNYQQNYNEDFAYILVPEYGEEKGRLHFHFLAKNFANDDLFINEYKHLDWKYIKERFGHVQITKIGKTDGDKRRVSFYCAKYITKNSLQLSVQRYFHSKFLKKPDKFCMHEYCYTVGFQAWLKEYGDLFSYYIDKSKNISCYALPIRVFYDLLESCGIKVFRDKGVFLYESFIPSYQIPLDFR